MEKLNHNYKLPLDESSINGIQGYMACMDAILEHIKTVTEFKPEKRYMDAVPLLDKITNTNKELGELLNQERKNIAKELQEK